MRGVDYSYARPGGAAIKAAGLSFVMRYIPTGAGARDLTIAERDDLQAHGLALGMVHELQADRTLDGYTAGATDARVAALALKALGFPGGFPVFFAVDFDTNPSHYSAIDAYFVGVDSVIGMGRVGLYGESDLIDYALGAGIATFYWQTTAWSHNVLNPHRNLFQEFHEGGSFVAGAAVDFNETNGGDFRWLWFAEGQPMTADEAKRLAVVEALLAGNGIDTDDDGVVDTVGADALAYAADHGFSAFYGIGLARKAAATAQVTGDKANADLADHIANVAAGVGPNEKVPPHKHTPGEVIP